MVYISAFPLLDGMPSMANILQTNSIKGAQVPPKSPIAVFAVKQNSSGENEMKPVAIQMDYLPSENFTIINPIFAIKYILSLIFAPI